MGWFAFLRASAYGILLLAAIVAVGEGRGGADSAAPLDGGGRTPAFVLENGALKVTFLPELGGKISSIIDSAGDERLSRASKPYHAREIGMKFSDTEFDGIDEIFPTLSEAKLSSGPWAGTTFPDHGDLFRRAWRQVPSERGVAFEAASENPAYIFHREARLDSARFVLAYAVTNSSDSPLPFLYSFHPLFKGETGCRMDLPGGMKARVVCSNGGWMGAPGAVRSLDGILNADGSVFLGRMFVKDSGRYWKFFTERLRKGEATLTYADGSKIRMAWPVEVMPYLAVWCSEGNVSGLNHIAPEPSVSQEESLEKAVQAGEAIVVPSKGVARWEIELEFTPRGSNSAR